MNIEKIQKFTEDASPDNWLKYADELKRNAFTLYNDSVKSIIVDFNSNTQEKKDRPAISRSFMLMAGLSIENALKSYIVAVDPSVISKGVLDRKFETHDLCKLKDLCDNLIFNEKETELLKVFSEAIPYWGRYPVPRHFEHIKTEKIVSQDICETYKIVFEKIFNATLDKIKDGWNAGNGVSFESISFKNIEDN